MTNGRKIKKMKSLAFFNNKGGVGKTTLTCNIAYTFAEKFDKKVLVIDCDPQCNTSILVLGEEVAYNIYSDEESNTDTVLTVLQPLEYGDSSPNVDINPIKPTNHRFKFDLLPGHPRVSILEEKLSQSWRDAAGGEIEGLRRTNWAKILCNKLSDKYDLIFFDLGPSLGSLNRSCLIASDHFVSPMGADIFSSIGLKNIGEWLDIWLNDYDISVKNCDNKYPGSINKFKLVRAPSIKKGFVGYTIQAYIAKYTGGERRPTKAFESVIKEFPSAVKKNLGKFTKSGTKTNLGEIPNMFSLIPLAQAVNAPIGELAASDGLVGSHYNQAKRYQEILTSASKSLAKNIGV